VHFIGKDITKFHCIYWPAFLASVFENNEKCFPRQVLVHGHWIKDGLKMSKSIGNIVEPCDLLSKFDINPLRLYFLGKGPLHRDMEFNEE